MTLKIEWGDEDKTFIYSRFTHNWTWDDFHANHDEYVDMLNSVSHRVDFVGDFTDVPILPTNLFQNTGRMWNARLANEGYIIVVNAGGIIQGMYGAVRRIFPMVEKHVIFVSSMDEALLAVQRDRQKESPQ